MADNIAVTQGSGTTIATDDVSGAHYQKVKLIDGTADSSAAIPGDATNGLDVDVTRLPASTNTLEVVGDVAQDVAVAGNPLLVGARASAAAPSDMSADGDSVYLWSTLKGALNVADAGSTLSVDDGASSLTVDGTVTANLAAGTNNIGDVDVLTIAAGDNNIGNVDIVTMPNVTLAAGTNTNEVVGDVAQDIAVAGNPVLIGGRASAAAPSDMSADGDSVYIWTTLKGAVNVADAGGSLTVDGTVTANAGTNLNTSLLALESGGNLAGAATSLALIDDPVFADDAGFTAAISKVLMIGGQYQSSPNALDDNDAGSILLDSSHRVQTVVATALPAGTNAIGKLAANSGVDIGDVDVTSLPALAAGTNLIGKTAAGLSTSEIYNGTTAVTPSYATIDTATSGDNTIVDPGAGKKVRVLAINFIAVGTAVNVYWKTGSTAKLGSSSRPIVLDKTGATGPAGFNSGFCPSGWFEGAADENLVLNLSAAQGVVGNVVYLEL